jgi:GWxTD domain-containing protein
MSLLDSMVASPLAGAVGWTLLHSLWQGAAVSAVLSAILLSTRSPRIRYASACAALLLMLAGFSLTLVRMMPETLRASRSPGAVTTAWNVHVAADAASPWDPSLAALAPWLAPFWIAGVAAFYLWHAAGFMAVRRLRRHGVCSAPERWQNELARLCVRLRLTRTILLLESSLADAPMVLGHLRPVILMPIGLLTGLPAGQIEAILLHELAHIRRHDYLANVLQRLVEGLLFYHPAVWWISRVIRTERENCCDDAVISIRGDALGYAAALVTLEQSRCGFREPAIAATGGSLVTRIRRLLYPKSNGSWTPFLAAFILMATAAVTLAAWQSDPPAQTSRYTRWLNEDVVYIIDDAERATFQRLTTDAERDKFIAQFWERRKPTFKEEHYRRIAYANDHYYGTSGTPGWQSDRGHMYIAWGPPDEIESFPSGNQQSPHGIEFWTYRHVEGTSEPGTFTFIDRTGHGDYRLAPGNARH